MKFLIVFIIVVAIIIFIVNKFKDNKKYTELRETFENNNALPSGNTNQCQFCGAELKPGSPFCEQCGHSVKDKI